MDSYFTLQTILDGIFKSHNLMGWKIFPEKSGSTMINIRVMGDKEALCDSDMGDIISCRKLRIINNKQMQRNTNRAKGHDNVSSESSDKSTRSRKQTNHYTDPRNIEISRSNDLVHQSPPYTMPSPDFVHVLKVTHDSEDPLICSPSRSDLDSTVTEASLDVNTQGITAEMKVGVHADSINISANLTPSPASYWKSPIDVVGDDGFRRPIPYVPFKVPDPIPDDHYDIEPYMHDDFYEILDLGKCKMGHCLYKERSGQGRRDPPLHNDQYDWSKENILVCELCISCPNEKFCIECINKGAHEGHRPWLRTF